MSLRSRGATTLARELFQWLEWASTGIFVPVFAPLFIPIGEDRAVGLAEEALTPQPFWRR